MRNNYESVLAQVKAGLAPFIKNGSELTEGTNLLRDLGLDSVQVLEMVLELEERFDISIPVNKLSDVHTLKDLTQVLTNIIDASHQPISRHGDI